MHDAKKTRKRKYTFRKTLQEATAALSSAYDAFNWVAQNPRQRGTRAHFRSDQDSCAATRRVRRISLHLDPVAILAGPRLSCAPSFPL